MRKIRVSRGKKAINIEDMLDKETYDKAIRNKIIGSNIEMMIETHWGLLNKDQLFGKLCFISKMSKDKYAISNYCAWISYLKD